MSESFHVELSKETMVFSAAHFITYNGDTCERLHGHNYRVFVEVAGSLSDCGLVIDFKTIKPVVRELLDDLDEHFLIPGEHPSLTDLDEAQGGGAGWGGDLKMTTDFRHVYATMTKEWLGVDDTKSVLKADFPTLGMFA